VGRPRQEPAEAITPEKTAAIAFPIDFDDDSELARQQPEVLHLDPWIVFWQAFEDRRSQRGEMRAVIRPFGPAMVGKPTTFAAERPEAVTSASARQYLWAFGDGASAVGFAVEHVFAQPGLYTVQLTVNEGPVRHSAVHWITVDGDPTTDPVLALEAGDEPSFRPWPTHATQVYGWQTSDFPRTFKLVTRPGWDEPQQRLLAVRNLGGGELGEIAVRTLGDEQTDDWLQVECREQEGTRQVTIRAHGATLVAGEYTATVWVHADAAVNGPQWFRVNLHVVEPSQSDEVIVDDSDPGFYATPHFWVGHRFCRCPRSERGCGGFYRTNGGRDVAGEFARFTPDLKAGRYEVRLNNQTPYKAGTSFALRVRHAAGENLVRVQPETSRAIGTFDFAEGTSGFVEILAADSRGIVIADAIDFRRKVAPHAVR